MTAPLLQYATVWHHGGLCEDVPLLPERNLQYGFDEYPQYRWDYYVSGEPKQGTVDTTVPAVTLESNGLERAIDFSSRRKCEHHHSAPRYLALKS